MNESTGPLISIVILNYNAEKFLDECLSSIYKTEKVNFEIILVDNASSNKSYREYTQKFPEIKFFLLIPAMHLWAGDYQLLLVHFMPIKN